MPETRNRPHKSSQYDAFPSQARDQCFTRLAKMRRNTVTYWTTADYSSLIGVFCTEKRKKKNRQVLSKPQIRLLLKNPGGTFLQIQTDICSCLQVFGYFKFNSTLLFCCLCLSWCCSQFQVHYNSSCFTIWSLVYWAAIF